MPSETPLPPSSPVSGSPSAGATDGPDPGRGVTAATGPAAGRRIVTLAAALDVACVLVFAGIGRASHHESALAIGGFARTAWPFLTGLAAGWVAIRAWRRPLAVRPSGLAVWLATVAGGMSLRAVSGQGVAVSFVIVASIFLALFLLGWRATATRLLSRRVPSGR